MKKSILNYALEVVDAAKQLELIKKSQDITISNLTTNNLMKNLTILHDAIENFDKNIASEISRNELNEKPSFSSMPQLEDEKIMIKEHIINNDDNTFENPELNYEKVIMEDTYKESNDKKIKIEEQIKENKINKNVKNSQIIPETTVYGFEDLISVRKGTGNFNNMDFGRDDTLLNDDDESYADFAAMLEAINDKLTYAIARIGWTPRLKQLALAARNAITNMNAMEEKAGGKIYVNMPIEVYGNLIEAATSAALDNDVNIGNIPKPKNKNDYDDEDDNELKI